MSLVGNLEDLSLGDIMQIISLSQKTGVLALNSAAHGSGRIVFRSGLICAASLVGRPEPKGDASVLETEVEAIVLHMFTWEGGDFSFDLRREADPEDPQFELEGGLNAQYLAMEGMRVRDEAARAKKPPEMAPVAEAAPPAVAPPTEAEDPFADWTFGEDENDSVEIAPPPVEVVRPNAPVVLGSIAPVLERPEHAEIQLEEKEDSPPAQNTPRARPLVLIDADAVFVGWAKDAFQTAFKQVHVFQQAEQGLARIRQYLIRGQFPIVLISSEIEIDPLCGIHGISDFVKRLKTQAPRLPIYCLLEEAEEGEAPPPRPGGGFDGKLLRPGRLRLQEWARTGQSGAAGELVDQLLSQLSGRVEAASDNDEI